MSDKQENSRQTPNDAATLRKQAEEQARSMEPIALSTQTPEGIQRMLHELRVHQIELEMQNEELRTAQAQIEAERARYFDFYNLATVGYCTLSEQELILDANLTTATLLATTRSELVTQPLSRFIHSDDQDIYYLLRKKLFETGEAQECDLRLVKPDGTLFWVHLTGTTTQGEDGASVCYMVLSDITERKRVEEALIHSRALFREMFKDHSVVMLLIDPNSGQIVKANQAAAQYYGYPLENLIQMKIQQLNVLSAAEIAAKMSSAFNRQVNIFEFRHVLADGQVRDVQVHSTPITIQNQILLFSIIQDITDRKRVEESVRESEERFRSAFEHSAIGMALVSPEGKWLRVNNRVADIVGYTADELMCKTFQEITHPEDLETDLDFVRQMLAGEIETYEMEKRYFHKDGHIVWGLLAVSLVRDKNGAPLHFISQIQDTTERKHHEQQLATALSEKEMLLREVHHRVKNNLAAIISLMDMQRRNLEDPNGQIILTELSNRIRSMSLIHEKLYRADSLATIDFHDYIQALTSHLRTTFGSPDIICQIDAPGVTIPLDLASPCGLIVNELVTNALKYAFPNVKPRPGNTVCRILVRLHRDNDTYTLTVADNGIGWPAGFDWKKTKTLGLTLVRMLGQHQLGGHYDIDQENGTSITLTFTDRKKEVPVHG